MGLYASQRLHLLREIDERGLQPVGLGNFRHCRAKGAPKLDASLLEHSVPMMSNDFGSVARDYERDDSFAPLSSILVTKNEDSDSYQRKDLSNSQSEGISTPGAASP